MLSAPDHSSPAAAAALLLCESGTNSRLMHISVKSSSYGSLLRNCSELLLHNTVQSASRSLSLPPCLSLPFSSLFSLSLTASSMLLQKKKAEWMWKSMRDSSPSPIPSSPLFSSWMVKDWSLWTDKQKKEKRKRNLYHPTHSMLQSTDGDNTNIMCLVLDSRMQGSNNKGFNCKQTRLQFNIQMLWRIDLQSSPKTVLWQNGWHTGIFTL